MEVACRIAARLADELLGITPADYACEDDDFDVERRSVNGARRWMEADSC